MKRKNKSVRKISAEQQRQMSWSMAELSSPTINNLDDLLPTPEASNSKAKKSKVESNNEWNDAANQFSIQLNVDVTEMQPTHTYAIGRFTAQISLGKLDALELHSTNIILSFPEGQVDGIATFQSNEACETTLQCCADLPADVLKAIHILVSKNRDKQSNAALVIVDNMQTDNHVLRLTLLLLLDSPAFATVSSPSQLIANTGASHLVCNLPIVIRHFLGHQINKDDLQSDG